MTEEQRKFAGGVAVITGAGSGIGMGLAKRAGKIGMTVVVTDIAGERAEQVAQEIRDEGGSAEAKRVDVSRSEELDRLADDVFARHGSVRLLINNAGIGTLGCVWEIPASRWDATLNVNIHGVVHGARAFAPKMIAHGAEAWIANVASGAAFGMIPTQVAYVMSKHAIQAFSEGLYLEMDYVNAPIHVSSVLPGMVKTRIFDREAGAGESEAASPYRDGMRRRMADYGMELPEACERIMQQIAANEFWVATHPEQLKGLIAGRIAFLGGGAPPTLNEQTRQMLAQ
jgi:short-subunit dehydrogenase